MVIFSFDNPTPYLFVHQMLGKEFYFKVSSQWECNLKFLSVPPSLHYISWYQWLLGHMRRLQPLLATWRRRIRLQGPSILSKTRVGTQNTSSLACR